MSASDLWRIAETNDVDELARVLPRAGDIDARNEHGMTALMKAAFHGHHRMVRALLEHGADPNLTRNDKFTALALAAFFGHTETVRILIEHGARTEVVTRSGTSPRMWATARTFGEVARCLDAKPPAPVTPPVVKTLKEPPEIWDLVQEVPRSFNAQAAFLSRIKSVNRVFAISVLGGLLLILACSVGVFVSKNSEARTTVQPSQPAEKIVVAASEIKPQENEVQPEPQPAQTVMSNHSTRKIPLPLRQVRPRAAAVENTEIREVSSAPSLVVAIPQVEPARPKPVVIKPSVSLSPQIMAPTKKAKVIQWP